MIKFRIHDIQVDMLFGRATNDTKLLEFQQQCFSQKMSQGIGSTSQPRLEYHIDDSDLVGTVSVSCVHVADDSNMLNKPFLPVG